MPVVLGESDPGITDASRAATGIDEVLQIMTVRSMSDLPVRGSVSSGNSFRTSTTSPARSPHAAMITMSTSAFRLIECWRTVFPAPKGPGVQKVPPFATGKKVSTVLILVGSVSEGFRRSAKQSIGRFTGQ